MIELLKKYQKNARKENQISINKVIKSETTVKLNHNDDDNGVQVKDNTAENVKFDLRLESMEAERDFFLISAIAAIFNEQPQMMEKLKDKCPLEMYRRVKNPNLNNGASIQFHQFHDWISNDILKSQ